MEKFINLEGEYIFIKLQNIQQRRNKWMGYIPKNLIVNERTNRKAYLISENKKKKKMQDIKFDTQVASLRILDVCFIYSW